MASDPPDDDDLEIRPAEETDEGDFTGEPVLPPPEPRGPGPVLWTMVGVLLLGATFGLVYFLRPRTTPVTTAPSSPSAPPPAASTSTPLALPPLEGSDAFLRQIVGSVSSHALFAAWLGQSDLVRSAAAIVLNVADGESPRAHLAFLGPKAAFSVVERSRGRLLIDPASYARYDPVADAFASVDAAAAARAYRVLEPLFETAYRELGHPEGGFSRALDKALRNLAAVPVVEGDVPVLRVKTAVVVYEYVDEKLEALSVPQKHLLRMGPRNVPRVQAKVRELIAALQAS